MCRAALVSAVLILMMSIGFYGADRDAAVNIDLESMIGRWEADFGDTGDSEVIEFLPDGTWTMGYARDGNWMLEDNRLIFYFDALLYLAEFHDSGRSLTITNNVFGDITKLTRIYGLDEPALVGMWETMALDETPQIYEFSPDNSLYVTWVWQDGSTYVMEFRWLLSQRGLLIYQFRALGRREVSFHDNGDTMIWDSVWMIDGEEVHQVDLLRRLE